MVAPGDDFGRKPWEEQRALLPPYPKGGLVPVYVGPVRPFDFFVDPGSVSVGNDGVVRYTLIARSASGAVNVSYEGIRCTTEERRTYAFGAPDGTWSQARNSEWIRITRMQANPHAALADDFFCHERARVRATEEILQALARGNQPR
jgi:CNP1-like family protein